MGLSTGFYIFTLILFAIHAGVYILGGTWMLKHRKGQRDRSRQIMGIYMFALAFNCLTFIATGLIAPAEKEFANSMLEPYPAMISFLVWLMGPLYILEIKNPNHITWGKFFWVLLPWMALVLIFVGWHASTDFATITPLTSLDSIVNNIGQTEVILRIALALIFLPYGCIMFISQKTWRETSVPQPWVHIISLLTGIVTITFILGMLCRINWAIILHLIAIDGIFGISYYMEKNIRVPVPDPHTTPNGSITRIAHSLEELVNTGLWKNPDIDRNDYCRLLGTNRQYLTEAAQTLGYTSILDMVNHYRIEYLHQLIEQNPNAKLMDLVFEAGFRNRETASRLYQIKYGQTMASHRREGGGKIGNRLQVIGNR